jgi:hypothetical protein
LGSKAHQPSLDRLTPTAWKLLEVVQQLKAFNAQTCTTREVVAAEADTGDVDSRHIKKAFAQLVASELIISKRRVGTWITTAGRGALESGKKGAT